MFTRFINTKNVHFGWLHKLQYRSTVISVENRHTCKCGLCPVKASSHGGPYSLFQKVLAKKREQKLKIKNHSILKVLLHTMAHHSRLRPHSTICILFPPFCPLHSHCHDRTRIFIYKDAISQNYITILLEPSRDYEFTKKCGNKII